MPFFFTIVSQCPKNFTFSPPILGAEMSGRESGGAAAGPSGARGRAPAVQCLSGGWRRRSVGGAALESIPEKGSHGRP